jgi:hypothetical protein
MRQRRSRRSCSTQTDESYAVNASSIYGSVESNNSACNTTAKLELQEEDANSNPVIPTTPPRSRQCTPVHQASADLFDNQKEVFDELVKAEVLTTNDLHVCKFSHERFFV